MDNFSFIWTCIQFVPFKFSNTSWAPVWCGFTSLQESQRVTSYWRNDKIQTSVKLTAGFAETRSLLPVTGRLSPHASLLRLSIVSWQRASVWSLRLRNYLECYTVLLFLSSGFSQSRWACKGAIVVVNQYSQSDQNQRHHVVSSWSNLKSLSLVAE